MNKIINIIVSIVTIGLGGLIVTFLVILNGEKDKYERGEYEESNKGIGEQSKDRRN